MVYEFQREVLIKIILWVIDTKSTSQQYRHVKVHENKRAAN